MEITDELDLDFNDIEEEKAVDSDIDVGLKLDEVPSEPPLRFPDPFTDAVF